MLVKRPDFLLFVSAHMCDYIRLTRSGYIAISSAIDFDYDCVSIDTIGKIDTGHGRGGQNRLQFQLWCNRFSCTMWARCMHYAALAGVVSGLFTSIQVA